MTTVAQSYPGIYIQDLLSNTYTITAAPTSITVFIGYTHPLKTTNPGKAVELFSFTDYEREFGGFFTSTAFDKGKDKFASIACAVNQFFLNGGSDAFVIGLSSKALASVDPPCTVITDANKTIRIKFIGREPTDKIPIMVSITNVQSIHKNNDTADITITYGNQIETYPKVNLDSTDKQNYIVNRIGSETNPISALVMLPNDQTYSKFIGTQGPQSLSVYPPDSTEIFSQDDFISALQQDSELDKLPIFNLLVLPGVASNSGNSILSEALAFCERKQAFLIMDPPFADIANGQLPGSTKRQGKGGRERGEMTPDSCSLASSSIYYDKVNPNSDAPNPIPQSTNGALYFPYVKSIDPVTGQSSIANDPATGLPIPFTLPPSGTVAGIYASTDRNRGVWKAPAGLETITTNVTGVRDDGRLTDSQQGVLNLAGINCLRTFPGVGTVVYGARTLVGYDQPTETPFQQWKYVPVRRMALFIEQTLYRNLGWVVFEPNDEPLWAAIRLSISNFMLSLFNQGALQGSTPSQAFQVKCDSSTTTSDDQNNGIVNIIVAFAPLTPAEFIIIKIKQLAGQVQS
ncbi:MAG: phage tail sheath C-terminal domain-containing protein [Nostoc sp.]|uniref:phage tail sheath family protein n=1 Tax=Nostoc sp. TaxID=1180 RepID=UPI002FFD23A4